jgi:hypothetical protein
MKTIRILKEASVNATQLKNSTKKESAMKLTTKIITITFLLAFLTGVASADTLFTKDELARLENWNGGKYASGAAVHETYIEPEVKGRVDADQGDTLFSEDVWAVLGNWDRTKVTYNKTVAEGYSEPKVRKTQRNTFFTIDEWEILGNINTGKALLFSTH